MSSTEIVIVTGASSGIGLKLSEKLLDAGHTVLGISRRDPSKFLRQQTKFRHLRLDLANTNFVHGLDDYLDKLEPNVRFSGFIHCAGTSVISELYKTEDAELIAQTNVNFLSAMLILQRIFQKFSESHARNIFIGSRARRFPFLGGGPYCSSKAALHALNDCLALEMRANGLNVGTTIIEFGTVGTGFAGVEVTEKQIDVGGAADLVFDAFKSSVSDYDTRVIEVVPSVRRLSVE